MGKKIEKVLASGGVAVMPTDTIYGLVGQALNEKTVERIYKIKGRRPEKPFIVLISDIDNLEFFGLEMIDRRVLDKLWPGPVSVILRCPNEKLKYLHRGTNSLAFRLPDDEKLISLIKKTGPLVAPSANPEGLEPATDIMMAKDYFGCKVDHYEDGGKVRGSSSALLDFTRSEPKVLRGDSSILGLLK